MIDKSEWGISLRRIQGVLIVLVLATAALLIYFLSVTYNTYQDLTEAAESYINLNNSADGLMDASDYLTEMAQRFTDKGKRAYMDAYFEEANSAKRREKSLEIVGKHPEVQAAANQMKQALDESISLMDREYYSMKLVIEALGYEDYPQVLRSIELSPEDKALSSYAKMDKAQSMLLDEDYYSQKDRIRSNMSKSQEALILATQQSEVELGQALEYDLTVVKVLIAVLVFIFLLSIGITIALAVNPILQAVKSIRADSQIPLVGASEFRYLAKAYNKMFEQHQSNIEQLSYKASHDALTKVYNRSGYELLLSSIDWKRIFYLLIDIDDFKHVNDTQGHEMGDEVLQYVASSIQRQFRNDDYICRIGGDEFAVLMTDADPSQWKLVEKKIDRINRDLMEASEDLALVSVSAGVVHGSDASTVEELYEYADEALYERKSAGKHGCTFYKQGAPVSSL